MAAFESGLAGEIRRVNAGEAEEFDLAGYTESRVDTLISAAFGAPLPATDMVKITFVVGAGKLARQKYDANLQKWVCAALRNLGFQEDKGASCMIDCAGTYKSQHDTGKNIMTVIIFPNVEGPSGEEAKEGEEGADGGGGGGAAAASAQEMAVTASMDMFPRMIASKCPAWSQKKRLVKILQDFIQALGEVQAALVAGTATEQQLALYDLATPEDVQAKVEWLTGAMKEQVEAGQLVAAEKRTLQTQVEAKLEALGEELAKLEELPEGDPKRAKRGEKLATQKAALEGRQELLAGVQPLTHHPLKREPQIREVWRRYEPLLQVAEGARGRMLTLAETRALGEKEDLEAEIARLEGESRGWFESDEEFETRLAVAREFRRNSANRGKKKR
eukprot:CAMPEP_0194568518 /NCGR_PEP_ID=MMETSP0292-20121207/6619_1 /TAXON_ID=39354 /ORGANISM="Heterosigma akashiwo, Strain CCMP2393" /LENGTH=388 /DNA_ID=CAMNT_0039418619 /DNA_START=70 /DNA_END=1236 /DNA_ORIENTATION=+